MPFGGLAWDDYTLSVSVLANFVSKRASGNKNESIYGMKLHS